MTISFIILRSLITRLQANLPPCQDIELMGITVLSCRVERTYVHQLRYWLCTMYLFFRVLPEAVTSGGVVGGDQHLTLISAADYVDVTPYLWLTD